MSYESSQTELISYQFDHFKVLYIFCIRVFDKEQVYGILGRWDARTLQGFSSKVVVPRPRVLPRPRGQLFGLHLNIYYILSNI